MSDKLPPKILMIENKNIPNAAIANAIERYWFDVIRVYHVNDALRQLSKIIPNVIIISSRIQGMSAIEMAASIKKYQPSYNVPIIFLVDQEEKIDHYNLTDNIFKILRRPFTVNSLMTSIRSVLKKSNPVFQNKMLKYNDIEIDLAAYKVFRKNREIHLGPTEFKILQLFIQQPNSVYTRKEIIDYVWGEDQDIAFRTIDVHINRIRTLMQKGFNDGKQLIKTIRSIGYCLN